MMPIAAWLAVKDINTEMHETLDSITTYQGEGPPGRRRVTLQVRDCRGRHWSALLWRNAVGFLTQRPQFEEYWLAQAYLRPGQSVGRRLLQRDSNPILAAD